MVYARLNIVPERLFDEVIINAFVREPGPIPPLTDAGIRELRRALFRGSADDSYGKRMRWTAETKLQPLLAGKVFSRNQLLNEGAELYQNRSTDTTDILHEYFLPREQAEAFLTDVRPIIRAHDANLLNVTVRGVAADTDTFLRYAKVPMVAFVMLFVQDRSREAEARMRVLTGELIDSALARGGRYYLPYRLHASNEQFRRAYPEADEFFRLKSRYDPDELFRNKFYATYAGDEFANFN
jgi:FAD/FMN-containing dehydrogenase